MAKPFEDRTYRQSGSHPSGTCSIYGPGEVLGIVIFGIGINSGRRTKKTKIVELEETNGRLLQS